MPKTTYKRILLKLSGESLKGHRSHGVDPSALDYMAGEIKSVTSLGIELGIVVGGGNIWRGFEAENEGMDRATADYAGMLATVISALALQDSLERKHKLNTRTLSAVNIQQVAEPYIRRRAIRHLEKGRVVIIAGGTGNPFFTTDSAAALRAVELNAEVVLKGTKVDGVYDKDPMIHEDAVKFENVSFSRVLNDNLRVMDMTAITLCKENNLPIRVFNINHTGDLKALVLGGKIGTLVSE